MKEFADIILKRTAFHGGREIWCRVQKGVSYMRAFGVEARFAVAGHRLPKILLYFGAAPGDDLLCTAALRELRKRGGVDV